MAPHGGSTAVLSQRKHNYVEICWWFWSLFQHLINSTPSSYCFWTVTILLPMMPVLGTIPETFIPTCVVTWRHSVVLAAPSEIWPFSCKKNAKIERCWCIIRCTTNYDWTCPVPVKSLIFQLPTSKKLSRLGIRSMIMSISWCCTSLQRRLGAEFEPAYDHASWHWQLQDGYLLAVSPQKRSSQLIQNSLDNSTLSVIGPSSCFCTFIISGSGGAKNNNTLWSGLINGTLRQAVRCQSSFDVHGVHGSNIPWQHLGTTDLLWTILLDWISLGGAFWYHFHPSSC